MNLIQFLQARNGQLSSKRLAGLSLIFSGIIGKAVLIYYCLSRLPKVDFSLLNGSLDFLIATGTGLLVSGLMEKKNENQTPIN